MDFELVSFEICPYVQRSVITLRQKGVEHEVSRIDLADPPEWFTKRSPLGKVPILIVRDGDREQVLFESAVINEYLDEVTNGSLLPSDALRRAEDRAWIEFSSEMLVHFKQLVDAHDPEAFEAHSQALSRLLLRLEERLGDGPFWHGAELGLVDAAFAPALQRVHLVNRDALLFDMAATPKVRSWTKALLAEPAVRHSVPNRFEETHAEWLRESGGVLAHQAAVSA